MHEYEKAKQSFEQSGFTEDCEYLIADNTSRNHFSAFEAISGFLKVSSAKYLILIHQDVRCIDKKNILTECLDKLSLFDKNWAVCGNAGSFGYHERRYYLTNGDEEMITEGLPARVTSLDENFLLINRNTNLTVSADLDGFHLYATDICLVADFLGYNSYVIPFKVNHLSRGNFENLKLHEETFVRQYGKKLRNRFIETTCTKFYLSNSVWKNKLFNGPFLFPFIKLLQRLRFTGRHIFFRSKSFKTLKRRIHLLC